MDLGQVRPDLYYRLNVLAIYLAPLRERRGDIPLLVRRFIDEFSRRHERPFHGITPDALQMLVDAPWPGNVRQLRNLIESMVVLAPAGEVRAADIPREIRDALARHLPVHLPSSLSRDIAGQELQYIVNSLLDLRMQVEELRRRMEERPQRVEVIDVGRHPEAEDAEVVVGRLVGAQAAAMMPPLREPAPVYDVGGARPSDVVVYAEGMKMADVERAAIAAALKASRGNRRKAAENLGIGERTLYRKLKEYHLDSEG
jgi:DNA-binding NtrC family response regulator